MKLKPGLRCRLLLPALAPLIGSCPTFAAEWDTGAGITASTYFTDNFCLSPTDKEAENVSTVTPSVRMTGSGARARMSLNARAEFNNVGQSDIDCTRGSVGGQRGNRRSIVPSGNFNGSFDAIENWLTLDANAYAGLSPVNPFSPGSGDVINGLDNTNVVSRWGVGAIVDREFEQKVGLRLRYNYNEQYNSVDQIYGNSTENRVNFNLGMLPGTSRFRLGASGRYSEVEFEDTALNPSFTNTLASAQVDGTVVINNALSLKGSVGEEFNEFLSVNEEIDGEYWDVGLRWTPSSRVVVDVGTGERFFGDTPRASVSYYHKRSSFRASYQKSLSFPRNLRSNADDVISDPTAPNIVDVPGDPITGIDDPVLVGDSPILTESTSFTYGFRAQRTNFSLSARESLQTRARDLSKGEFRSASASLRRSISQKMSVNLRLSWRESQGEGGGAGLYGQAAEAYIGSVALSRRLARRTSVSVTYQYTDQKSDFALNEYEENRLSISLRHTFK